LDRVIPLESGLALVGVGGASVMVAIFWRFFRQKYWRFSFKTEDMINFMA
jgi:hypothetical protein